MSLRKPDRGIDLDIPCDLGTWLESGVRNVPHGKLVWTGIRGRVYTASLGSGPEIARVRRALYLPMWSASIPGFKWDVRGDRGSNTTRALGMTESTSRGFTSSKAAMRAIEQAYKALLAAAPPPVSRMQRAHVCARSNGLSTA